MNAKTDLIAQPDVADAFYYERRPDYGGIRDTKSNGLARANGISNPIEVLNPRSQEGVDHLNSTVVVQDNGDADPMAPDPTTRTSPYTWDLSQISMPRGLIWRASDSGTVDHNGWYMFHYDRIAGLDQYIYLMDEDKVEEIHPVRSLILTLCSTIYSASFHWLNFFQDAN